MTESRFPEAIDNSMRKELVKCEMAAHYRYEMGLEAIETTRVDLVAGKAFAAGMEVMRKEYYSGRLNAKNATERGVAAVSAAYGAFVPDKNTTKTVQRMAGAVTVYAQDYPLDTDTLKPITLDGEYAIEVQFQTEIPVLHPTTAQPLKYVGRFDLLAQDQVDGKVWVVDDKTTSQMGDKWANQWFLDSQVTGYCFGARTLLDKHGMSSLEIGGAIINGIAIRKYDYECQRLNVYREQWEIDRWYQQMLRDVKRWKDAYTAQIHNQALDHACAFYNNPCQFAPLCKSRNPERLIDGSYVVRRWNPIERD